MHSPVRPKPVAALEAHGRGSGVPLLARARSRTRPVSGLACSQKKRKHRCDRSSRNASSSFVRRRPTAAADKASGIPPTNARLVSMVPVIQLLAISDQLSAEPRLAGKTSTPPSRGYRPPARRLSRPEVAGHDQFGRVPWIHRLDVRAFVEPVCPAGYWSADDNPSSSSQFDPYIRAAPRG